MSSLILFSPFKYESDTNRHGQWSFMATVVMSTNNGLHCSAPTSNLYGLPRHIELSIFVCLLYQKINRSIMEHFRKFNVEENRRKEKWVGNSGCFWLKRGKYENNDIWLSPVNIQISIWHRIMFRLYLHNEIDAMWLAATLLRICSFELLTRGLVCWPGKNKYGWKRGCYWDRNQKSYEGNFANGHWNKNINFNITLKKKTVFL